MADVQENGSSIRDRLIMDPHDNNGPDFEDMRNSIQYRHGMYFTLSTILFFQCVNWILKSQGPPKTLRQDEWKWRNLYVSWIHAFICSIWTLSSFICYPELIGSLLTHINHFTYFNVCFALGYFLYDFLDLIVNNKVMEMWEVIVHHIAVAGMFYYNVHIKSNIGFNLVALLVEVNSVFLHWRKLLQMVGTPFSNRQYTIIKYANLVSFTVFRFGPLIAITTAIFFWRLKVSMVYYVCICISMFVMDTLNVILFKRLFKSDVLRSYDGQPSTAFQTLKRDFRIIISNGVDDNHISSSNNNTSKSMENAKNE